MTQAVKTTTITSSAIVVAADKEAVLLGIQVGTDGTNVPTVTVYNNTAASGDIIVPTSVYPETALGGFTAAYGKRSYNGIYCAITCAGVCTVTLDYRSKD